MKRSIFPLCFALLVVLGCGRKKETQTPVQHDDARSLEEAAARLRQESPVAGAELAKAMEAMSRAAASAESSPVSPINFRTLREMLPATAAGLPRRAIEGQTQMGVSQAQAHYADETGERSIQIVLTDSGSMRGVLAAGAAFMLNTEMDRETEKGMERTTSWNGYRLYEKQEETHTEVKVLIADRFFVEITGNGLPLETLRKVLVELPLKKLEALKNEGARAGNSDSGS